MVIEDKEKLSKKLEDNLRQNLLRRKGKDVGKTKAKKQKDIKGA